MPILCQMYFLVLFRVDQILNRLFNVFMDMICQHYYKTVCIISVSSRNKAFVMNVNDTNDTRSMMFHAEISKLMKL